MKFYQYNIKDLSDESNIHYYSLMSEEKKRRVDRFRFENDKKRTIVGEMLARQSISEWCGVPEESIVFEITEHGKPYAKDLNVEFNISHSADMVVCVVDNNPVGVDIEKIRPIDLSVAKRICTDKELMFLFGRTPQDKDFCYTTDYESLSRFFEIWTEKEAIGKCVGQGVFSSSTSEFIKNKQCLNDYFICIATQRNN